ncbi:MAG TPA: amino acid ABC transporter substrate-binding protein [Firmicutes bacterium]|nr:amino acid ABC transporter substrate-binding protein [Bacillota bacterium]
MGKKETWIFLLGLTLFVAGCQKAPVKIGFIGCITGKGSDLGISAKNGAFLARDYLNERGGIRGRNIEILVKDDRMDPEQSRRAVEELEQEHAYAIIGPLTSNTAVASTEEADKREILLMSPSATTDELTGLDDWFFRIQPPNSYETRNIAQFIIDTVRPKKVAVFIDLSNSNYTLDWYHVFKEDMSLHGHIRLIPMEYDSREEISYYSMVRGLLIEKPDCVLLIVNGLDAALICQQMDKMKIAIPVFSSIWAKTTEFINHAGKAGEGVFFFQHYEEESRDPFYLEFKDLYLSRYGVLPDYAAKSAFEALLVLKEALSEDLNRKRVKAVIREKKRFRALQGDILFSPQGDPLYDEPSPKKLVVVHEGRFVAVGALESEDK